MKLNCEDLYMRKFYEYFVLFLILSVSSSNVFSQSIESAGAQITATIVGPVGISKTENTDFGIVAIIFSGTVEITPAGTKSKKGNIVLPVYSGTFTATVYNISGSAGYSYTVSYRTLPMIFKSGPDAMQVASCVLEPVRDSGSDLIAGVFVSVTPANLIVNYN